MRSQLKAFRLAKKIMTISDEKVRYEDAYEAAEDYYRLKPTLYWFLVQIDTDLVAKECARRLMYGTPDAEYDEEHPVLLIEVGEYIYYLRSALIKNCIPGFKYSLMRRKNNRVCLYMEDDHWIVEKVLHGNAVSLKSYKYWEIWNAVFAFVDQVTQSEAKRKKIKYDYGCDANWAEKMSGPLIPRIISRENPD